MERQPSSPAEPLLSVRYDDKGGFDSGFFLTCHKLRKP
jgi:hypothetical protein